MHTLVLIFTSTFISRFHERKFTPQLILFLKIVKLPKVFHISELLRFSTTDLRNYGCVKRTTLTKKPSFT